MTNERFVLVVEDDPAIRTLVRTVLEEDGIAVVEASDGTQALAKAREGAPPAAALLDYMLPHMDGVEVGAALRREFGGTLPLVFMSATGIPNWVLQEVDAFLFIPKPFEIDALLDAIRTALSPIQPQPFRAGGHRQTAAGLYRRSEDEPEQAKLG